MDHLTGAVPLVLKCSIKNIVLNKLMWFSSVFKILLQVSQFEKQISSANLVCLDGNIPVSTIDYVCSIAKKHNINGTVSLGKWLMNDHQ